MVVEQLGAQAFFQTVQVFGKGGLGQMKLFSGPGQVFLFYDGQKIQAVFKHDSPSQKL